MPEACWAPPHTLPQSGGRSTHQSSSTTRTSTKNVFLLTRFLNVSANGENFSYVEDALRKAPCSGAGARGVSGGLPSPSPRLLCRRCGREAAAAGTQGTGRHGTRAGGSAAKRDSAQGPDSSQPPPLLPAELSPPHRPGLPGSVQPGVPVGLPETPRAASLSSGRERWSQTTCPNPDLGNVCGPWGLSPLLACSHHLPTLQALEERLLWPHAALRHPPPPAPPGVTVSAVLLCSPSTPPPASSLTPSCLLPRDPGVLRKEPPAGV